MSAGSVKTSVQLLTVQEVADLLGIHPRTVWRMCAAGELPQPLRLGPKTIRWRLSELEKHLTSIAG